MTKSDIKNLVNKVLLKTNKFEDVFTKADSMFTTQRDIKPILASIKESNRNSFKYPVEIRGNFKSYKVELATVFDMIRNGDFKLDQELLERLIEVNNLLPTVFFENRKKFTPCGVFYHKLGRLDIRILNQLLLFESKKLALNQTDIQNIKSDEYTFAFFRQIFPDRNYLLVRTSNMNSRNYFEYQDSAEAYYTNLLGAKKFISMDLNSLIPFSYDTELYNNTQSKSFTK